jgi:hypothetical protein
LNDVIENLPSKIDKFLEQNTPLVFIGVLGIAAVGGYLGTGIIKNILEIQAHLKSKK